MRHIFIINPRAGKRDQTSRIYEMAEGLRTRHGLDCACMLTERPGGAEDMARKIALTGEAVRIYACGGDGTASETANGIAGFANAAMTCVPIGTGNDLLKNFGPEMMGKFSDAENLWNGDAFPLDLIDCNGRLGLTIACSGIDARVAESVHDFSSVPLIRGRGTYLASVAVNFLFRGIGQKWTIWLDEEKLEGEFALAAMCNGRYYGGGSTPVPEARMDDGILDTMVVKSVSRTAFARLFGAYSRGEAARFPEVAKVYRAKVVRIQSAEEIVTCVDGECRRSREVVMRLSEKRVNFFGPKGCSPNATCKEGAVSPLSP